MEMTPYSKDGRRTLSRFHAEEMIFEYCAGHLDPIRQKIVKESLQLDSTLMMEVERVRKALEYCGELSHYPISVAEIETLKHQSRHNLIEILMERTRIQQWPAGLRLGLESLLVVSAIFVVALLVPWNRLLDAVQNEKGIYTLSEIRRDYRPDIQLQSEMLAGDKPTLYDDEGFPETEAVQFTKPPAEKLSLVPQLSPPPAPAPIRPDVKDLAPPAPSASAPPLPPPPHLIAATVTPPNPVAPPAAVSGIVAAAKPSEKIAVEPIKPMVEIPKNKEVAARAAASTKDETARESTGKGFLYRGQLDVTNVDATTTKLVSYITDLGGRKAGNVPIGWRKDRNSYFHFTIPAAKYNELIKFFKEYGTLKINKESHSRVMPEGIIRLIVEVNEKRSSGKHAERPEGP